MEMRSCGTQPRKWKYRWEPYFRGTKWEYFFIWTFQQSVIKLWLFSVTKLRLLLLVVQYRVCFYLEWRINNLMILVIYPIWGGGKWSRWEDLNLRPLRPERSTLPDCATPRLSAHSLTQQLKNGNGGVCSLLNVKCFARRQFSVVDPA